MNEEILYVQYSWGGGGIGLPEVDYNALSLELGVDVVPAAAGGDETPPATNLTIPMYRINAYRTESMGRLTIESPRGPDDFEWMVRVYSALNWCNPDGATYFALKGACSYEPNRKGGAAQYLANRIVRRSVVPRELGDHFDACSVVWGLRDSDGIHRVVRLEPRHGDLDSARVYLAVDAFFEQNPAPTPDALRTLVARGVEDLRLIRDSLDREEGRKIG